MRRELESMIGNMKTSQCSKQMEAVSIVREALYHNNAGDISKMCTTTQDCAHDCAVVQRTAALILHMVSAISHEIKI